MNRLADGSDGLAEAVADFTDRIVALSPTAVRQTLETYRASETMPLEQSLTLGMHLNQLLDAAGSFRDAGQAFAGKEGRGFLITRSARRWEIVLRLHSRTPRRGVS